MNDEIINLKTDREMDLSIVMPAYNVEKYIKECIESIIGQKTKNVDPDGELVAVAKAMGTYFGD